MTNIPSTLHIFSTDKEQAPVQKEGEKRKRTKLACDECHKKRIKCDGQVPCSNCIRSMSYCEIARQITKRGPKAGYVEKLESRIRLLESLLTPQQWMTLEQLHSQELDVSSGQEVFFISKF